MAEVLLSMCDILWTSLLVMGKTSPVLVEGSSVILAIGSSRVAAEDLVVPLWLHWAMVSLSHCSLWELFSDAA